ncbi:MAG: hypothetical protein GX154_04780, partial [Clostridiales bacterium]|nr:hypothetical protein [Clostridiales bacterium]
MLKMLKKRVAVTLIVSMFLQLFAGITLVAEDNIGGKDAGPAVFFSEVIGAADIQNTDDVDKEELEADLSSDDTKKHIHDKLDSLDVEDEPESCAKDYSDGLEEEFEQESGAKGDEDAIVDQVDDSLESYEEKTNEDMEDEVDDINQEDIDDFDHKADRESNEEDDIEDIGFEEEMNEDTEIDDEFSNGMDNNFGEPNLSLMMSPEHMAVAGYSYIDENGVMKNTGDKAVTKIASGGDFATLGSGWYIVEGNIESDGLTFQGGEFTINGDVHLILADNSHLSVRGFFDAGINVSEGNSLTIYAQSEGEKMGVVNATGHFYAAGIGSKEGNSGSITINGGNITAKGGGSISTGIGGGLKGSGGKITINGGKVTAIGGTGCAGIGGSSYGNGGIVTIGGGIVIAKGGNGGAGIGGGYGGEGGTIIIKNGPTVIAAAGEGAADIGNGQSSEGTTVIKRDSINGNDLTYVKLELQNLAPDKTHSIAFNGKEYKIDGKEPTGFFAERSTEDRDIIVKPEEVLININPGDVQNSKIIINMKDYSDPVAGFGSVLDFPVNSQARIDIPLNYDTSIGGMMDSTISMWIFPNGNEPYQTLFRQYKTDIFSTGAWLRYIKSNDKEGYLYFGLDSLGNPGGWQWVWNWNNGAPPPNVAKIPFHQWTHVALTKSGKKVTLYANGEKYYEMTLDNTHYYSGKAYSGNISIGGSSIDDQFFSGKMDEIQFWNIALTSDEIKAWMYREIDKKHPKYNNLFYYYRFNEKGGTTVFDSKELYNGTMVNMTESSYSTSDVTGWSIETGSVLTGQLVGSHARG